MQLFQSKDKKVAEIIHFIAHARQHFTARARHTFSFRSENNSLASTVEDVSSVEEAFT